MAVPILHVGDLTLTAPSVDDAQDWAAAQDDECAKWFDWPGRPPLDSSREAIDHAWLA